MDAPTMIQTEIESELLIPDDGYLKNSVNYLRRRIVYVSREFITTLFINGRQVLYISGLPQDAKCLSVFFDYYKDKFALLYESQEFPEIKVGDRYPEFKPRITKAMKPY